MADVSPIDAYLASVPADQREALQHLRSQIARLVPDAVETISYGLPAFKLHGGALVWFAAWKAHCSIYPVSDALLDAHADELKGYRRTKGSLHFTPAAPLPEALVEELVRWRVADLEGGRDEIDLPRRVPLSHRRAIVRRHTRLRQVDGVTGVRLHLADEASPVWRATEAALGIAGAPIPFWAFAWAGGLAIARFLQEHPDEVSGKNVVDFATGSGLCAIVAMREGATRSAGIDIDPFAEAAVALNARSNGVRVGFIGRDPLDEDPPDADVLLAGDTWYEGPLAERVLPWLRRVATNGTRVLVGDPGRRYLPADDLVALAAYEVHTTTQLEDRAVLRARVFTLPGSG